MGEKWRVTVERFDDEVWIEEAQLVASREQLARFAPGVVAEALGVWPTLTETLAAVSPPAALTEVPAGTVIEPVDEKPKRARRTKAQIEADEAAAKLAEQSAERERVNEQISAPTDPYPGVTVTTALESVAPVPPAAPFNPFAPK